LKSIIIHGSSGFVGTHLLTSTVLNEYDKIILVDPRDSLVPLDTFSRSCRMTLCRHLPDVDEPADAIICVAGATSVDAALEAPADAFRTNVEIAVQFCEYLRKFPNTYGIYMSSDEVLGASDVPLSVDAPLAPTQPYAASKAAAETTVRNYADVYSLRIAVVRSCNLVGDFQREPKLIPTLVASLSGKRPAPIHGSGLQRREFLAVEDLCGAMSLLLTMQATGLFQAASGVHLSVLQVANLVQTTLTEPMKLMHVPDRLVQDRDYSMDDTSLRSLGWLPTIEPVTAIRLAAKALFKHTPVYLEVDDVHFYS